MVTRIALLGSTGSVGRQALEVIEAMPDRFRVTCLAGASNTDLLAAQAARLRPSLVVSREMIDLTGAGRWLPLSPEALIEAATHAAVDLVLFATTGHDAIAATMAAIEAGKQIAIANKEALVCAGELIMPLAQRHGVTIRSVDSEHSAIWQAIQSGRGEDVDRLVITASGGPFRRMPIEEMATVTVEQALAHPTWAMGGKITLDSATMVNKGLELIEAHQLFGIPFDRIDIVVHPESIVHSLVQFTGGSTIAQMSSPDMRLPIQYALTWPRHLPGPCLTLDLVQTARLTFEAPDETRFPALRLAREAGIAGATYPTVYSAVDEVGVDAFMSGRIGFTQIVQLIDDVVALHRPDHVTGLEVVQAADRWARDAATRRLAVIARE